MASISMQKKYKNYKVFDYYCGKVHDIMSQQDAEDVYRQIVDEPELSDEDKDFLSDMIIHELGSVTLGNYNLDFMNDDDYIEDEPEEEIE